MKKFNRVCRMWTDFGGSVPMPECKPAKDESKRYKHKDGGIYILRGYVGTAFDGNNYTLVAYSPEDENSKHEVYFRTQAHFNSAFKEVKEEYEYQWLILNKESNKYYHTLAFYGDYATENSVLERFKRWIEIDYTKNQLVKIEETKRLKK